ncbi:MAG TPA: Fur family transcriptional regulator [Candidatus Binatia bacterium]|nr:Fur family transcriptional regulator [Candidatus Binatia bacterium]
MEGTKGSASGERSTRTEAGRPVWTGVRERLRARGLRWTAQRRTLVEVLAETSGHVTGAELVERCRAIDPSTIPSTVYRTLAVLEELGLVWHGHGPDGREEFHVRPIDEHGHLHCRDCGRTVEIGAEQAAALVAALEAETGFLADLSHVTIVGRCADCRADDRSNRAAPSERGGSAVGSAAPRTPLLQRP